MKSLSQWIQRSIPKIACAFFGLLLLCSQLTVAQSTNSGDIQGAVTDPTGAVVPEVTVTVLNVDTGISKNVPTNQDGLYDTSSIVPGHYTVTFRKDGFETLVRGPVTVVVGYTAVDARLKVGATTEQVTVTTDVPLLNTEGGDQTVTWEADSLDQLPQVAITNNDGSGNSWENFTLMLPGSSGNASNWTKDTPVQVPAVNGSLPFNNILMDGSSTTLPASGNGNPVIFDDLSEVQISLSNFSAQYGEGGYVINQVTRGGTDQFHGSAYEYNNNDFFNAPPFGFGQKVTAGRVRYNDYGFTVGGPVAIPQFKKKAFFFFGYDRIDNLGHSTGLQTVPTSQFLAGNFNGGGYPIYDPTTQTIGYDGHGNPYPIRQTFASECAAGIYSNCTGNQIPQSLIDSVSAKFAQYYPTAGNSVGNFVQANQQSSLSNNGGQAGNGVWLNNWYANYGSNSSWRRFLGRFDYDITRNNRLTVSDNQGDNPEQGGSPVTPCPIACESTDVDNNNAQISDVWTISPSMINEARMGYTDQLNFNKDSSEGLGIPAQLGWQYAKGNDLPNVVIAGGYYNIQPQSNGERKEFVFDPSDVVTLIRGKHNLHVGGEFTAYRDDDTFGNGALNAGNFNFSGGYTGNWTLVPDSNGILTATPNESGSGEGMADFLLGYSSSWSANVNPESGARLKKPQMFAQDDWKLRRNLTVNLGLRYEISHGFNEVHGNEGTWDPTVKNDDGSLGAFWYGTTHANGRTSLQADVFSTFLPRAGFSWQPFSGTTVRGGIGLYSYNFSLDNGGGQGLGNYLNEQGSVNDTSLGIYPIVKFGGAGTTYPLGGGTPAALPFSASGNTDPGQFNGQSVNFNLYHTPIGKNVQWNFTLEHQVHTEYVVTLAYVASHGYNLVLANQNLNAIPEADISPETGANYGDRPYLNFSSINGDLYYGYSNYNSLQAGITKRMKHGLSMNFNYVWSHMLDTGDSAAWGGKQGTVGFQHDSTLTLNQAALNYGPSDFDQRQAFKGYMVYQLPFGKGQQFLNSNRIADEVVGGWQFTGMVLEMSGGPVQPYSPNGTGSQAGWQYPNVVPGVSQKPKGGRSWQNWFNPGAWSLPANFTFGDSQRNSLLSPGINQFNLSGAKKFSITENVKFEIRCDSTNVFNHPQFQLVGTNYIYPLGFAPGVTPTTGTPFSGPTPVAGTTGDGRMVELSGRITF